MLLHDVDVKADLLVYECGVCHLMNGVKISELKLGHGSSPDMVYFPECVCGAVSFMMRTWKETDRSPQKQAVNMIAQVLEEKGQITSEFVNVIREQQKAGRRPKHVASGRRLRDINGRRAAENEKLEKQILAEASIVDASLSEEDQVLKVAIARREAMVKIYTNKKLGRALDAPVSAEEFAISAAELTRQS